jgi:hypothetical protein
MVNVLEECGMATIAVYIWSCRQMITVYVAMRPIFKACMEGERRPWLAMSGFVSVGSTTQTTDIFVCCQHVPNVSPTCRRHSVMSANILNVSVVSGNFVTDTISYMYAGISTSEVRTTSLTCTQESHLLLQRRTFLGLSANAGFDKVDIGAVIVAIKLLSHSPPFDQRNWFGVIGGSLIAVVALGLRTYKTPQLQAKPQ